jgi:hypothetical protein
VRDGALDGALLGPGAAAPLQRRRRRRGGREEEPVRVAARRRGGRAQRRDARRRGLCGGHEAHPADDPREGLAAVADLVVAVRRGRPRAGAAVDVAGPGRGEEEGPDVVPGRPPPHHLEPLGPRRLLTAHRLGLGGAVSRRRRVPLDPASLLLLQQPLNELQPRRQVEREEVAPVEELVRRRRERRLLLFLPPAPAGSSSALELEARRGGRLRRGRRRQVHVDVVVLDHHCRRPRRRRRHGNAGFWLGWLEGRGNETKMVYTVGFWAALRFSQREVGWVWVHTAARRCCLLTAPLCVCGWGRGQCHTPHKQQTQNAGEFIVRRDAASKRNCRLVSLPMQQVWA